MVFSPAKNGLWSSIGFPFFVVAMTLQFYPLVSAFFTVSKVTPFNSSLLWNQSIPVYLSDRNNSFIMTYGNTTVGALKCALANIIAFAAILGRAGLLETLVLIVFGTTLY